MIVLRASGFVPSTSLAVVPPITPLVFFLRCPLDSLDLPGAPTGVISALVVVLALLGPCRVDVVGVFFGFLLVGVDHGLLLLLFGPPKLIILCLDILFHLAHKLRDSDGVLPRQLRSERADSDPTPRRINDIILTEAASLALDMDEAFDEATQGLSGSLLHVEISESHQVIVVPLEVIECRLLELLLGEGSSLRQGGVPSSGDPRNGHHQALSHGGRLSPSDGLKGGLEAHDERLGVGLAVIRHDLRHLEALGSSCHLQAVRVPSLSREPCP